MGHGTWSKVDFWEFYKDALVLYRKQRPRWTHFDCNCNLLLEDICWKANICLLSCLIPFVNRCIWFSLYPTLYPTLGHIQIMCHKCHTLWHILLFSRFCSLKIKSGSDWDANCIWTLIYDLERWGMGVVNGWFLRFGIMISGFLV